jgi:hypothetical protein
MDYARILYDLRQKSKETQYPLLSEAYIIELWFYEGLLGVFYVCTSMQ